MGETAPAIGSDITLANWYWGPANRWAWRNMRRLFPTARVGRGGGAVSPLETALRDLSGLGFTDPVGGAPMTVGQMLEATYTDGFLVLHRGRIVTELYVNGLTADEPHLLMSVTKSVVGALAGILAERGQIELEERVTAYLPELAGTVYDGATLRQVLDMTVADSAYDGDFPVAEMRGIDEAAGWLPQTAGTAPGLRAWLGQLRRPHGPHGERFLYLTQSTTVFTWAMERATGIDLARLLGDEIWSKLGAEQDGYMLLDGHQEAYSSPGFNATLRDLGRFGQMMAQGGRYNGRQIVPGGWIDDIRHNGDREAWRRTSETVRRVGPLPGHDNGSYRSFWWVAQPSANRYTGIGLGGQMLVVDPAADIVVVKFSSPPDDVIGAAITRTQYQAIEAIIGALTAEAG